MINIAEHPVPGTWVLDLRATTPRALPDMRAWVVRCLPDLGEGHRDDVLLAATELVANAYVHGGGARHIQLWRGVAPCAVRIEVADVSVEQPRARCSQIEDPAGAVSSLSTGWPSNGASGASRCAAGRSSGRISAATAAARKRFRG
ncbi:ATPase [Amycolatopsis sp. EV170708-02-1]|uniref:ATP-binding protein n=1 Tax=Amycolatopsis sp. EV170708-02-1 TaxID=2919322 RepID=UPI001F0CBCFA|nr:ATPase [Amycolatopsis sp. EV170708-02-1]UMO99437.1 ATPase [Amycolatopsis sp. EV170708-02-1]